MHSAEENYYQDLCNKLNDKNNVPGQKWWFIAKSFLGKNTNSAVPPISDGKNVAYTKCEKATAFNIFSV